MCAKEFWQKNEEAEEIIDTQLNEMNLSDPAYVKQVVTELITAHLGHTQREVALRSLQNGSSPNFEEIFRISCGLSDNSTQRRLLKQQFIQSLKAHLIYQQQPEMIGGLTTSFIKLLSTL